MERKETLMQVQFVIYYIIYIHKIKEKLYLVLEI